MRRVRFNQIFAVLLILCLLSAFVLPDTTRPAWSNIQVIFNPVSTLSAKTGKRLLGRFSSNDAGDARNDADIRNENQALRVEIAQLQGQLDAMSRMAAERRQLGGLLNYCTGAQVIGADSEGRDALNISTTDPPAIAGQPVVCPLGLVGRVQTAGAGGGKVLLITDKAARPISVSFGRMVLGENGRYTFSRLATDRTLFYGRGNDELVATEGLSLAEVQSAGLRVGDWAVLDDTDFPVQLAGLSVGKVIAIRPSVASPLYADIFLRPATNLEELQEVLVVKR